MERKKYDVAINMECIRMVEEDGLRGIEVSRKLGIHEKTIYRWLAVYRKDSKNVFPGKGRLRPKDEVLRRLKNKCGI